MLEKLRQALTKEEESSIYWKRYEKGIDYLNRKGIITNSNLYWNFYIGRQWEGLNVSEGNRDLPVTNFTKKIVNYKVATISQNNMVAHYSDSRGRTELTELYEKFDQLFLEAWELAKENMEMWNVLKDASITGDGIQYAPDGDFSHIQRIPNTSILYGDESEFDIQKQPYIITYERRTIASVREEARRNGLTEEDVDRIIPDRDRNNIIGNKAELDEDGTTDVSKVMCVNYFYLDDEHKLHIAKSTKNVVFAPDRVVEATNELGESRAMTMYPFIKMSWEYFPNSARGISDVGQIIANQIEVNKTNARRSVINKTMAFPKMAYDPTFITNPEELEKAGGLIEVTSGGAESVQQAVAYLSPANISGEPASYAAQLMDNTLELSGAGETATGNIDPTRVAASAINTIKESASNLLKEQWARAEMYVEDFAKLVLEIKAVYEPDGFTVEMEKVDELTGETYTTIETVTKEELDVMSPRIRIDTSQDTAWNKVVELTNLKEMLQNQQITFEEFVDALPQNSDMPKAKLQQIVEKRKKQAELQAQQNQALGMPTEDEIAQGAVAAWQAEDEGAM